MLHKFNVDEIPYQDFMCFKLGTVAANHAVKRAITREVTTPEKHGLDILLLPHRSTWIILFL